MVKSPFLSQWRDGIWQDGDGSTAPQVAPRPCVTSAGQAWVQAVDLDPCGVVHPRLVRPRHDHLQ
jgi:hypothetical protein